MKEEVKKEERMRGNRNIEEERRGKKDKSNNDQFAVVFFINKWINGAWSGASSIIKLLIKNTVLQWTMKES